MYFPSLQFYSNLHLVCVLYGGSLDEESRQGLSDAVFYVYLFHCRSTLVFCVCVCVSSMVVHLMEKLSKV